MKPKKLNRQVVRSAATMLMLIDGNTTASIVKDYLRDRGYRAGQSEVACWLLRIAQREGWIVNDKGTCRVYQFPAFMNKSVSGVSARPTIWMPLRTS
ncbi:hypothetical protein J2I47_24625 [Fibrella sp. HMF5335]|uniref:Uncharacterized protein n=1 Tax=Fibrella rubiginis TaxID=2817060 RepID=A0A939GIL4_9BACT|nr:hypothetical protein [Fibrella rubiginis]MBO0939754.1 hypothetical protein [Fibrella rubiginis]